MPHAGNRKSDFCQVCLQRMNTSIDCKTNEFFMLSLSCVFFCLSSVCVALVCMCTSDLFVCVYAYCVCPCLFRLAVPTVLARKRSPPPRADPGGVCLGRPGGGHHQQNIPDLQRSAGTATPRGIMLADGAGGGGEGRRANWKWFRLGCLGLLFAARCSQFVLWLCTSHFPLICQPVHSSCGESFCSVCRSSSTVTAREIFTRRY